MKTKVSYVVALILTVVCCCCLVVLLKFVNPFDDHLKTTNDQRTELVWQAIDAVCRQTETWDVQLDKKSKPWKRHKVKRYIKNLPPLFRQNFEGLDADISSETLPIRDLDENRFRVVGPDYAAEYIKIRVGTPIFGKNNSAMVLASWIGVDDGGGDCLLVFRWDSSHWEFEELFQMTIN